jgi:hypothetical protein
LTKREQVAARIALGPAQFEQQLIDVVFHLDGVNHPRAVLPCLVDENDGGRADRHQHQKCRREQKDLSQGASSALRLSGHNGRHETK